MGESSSDDRAPEARIDAEEAARLAAKAIARWRGMGFDSVLWHRSGYCSPANSATQTHTLREGYRAYPIDSTEAHEAVATSTRNGAEYPI